MLPVVEIVAAATLDPQLAGREVEFVVKDHEVVIGKFLAALAVICSALVMTFFYALTIASIGDLDWGPVVGGYLGLALCASALVAVGVMTSSWSRNQIIAFIVAMAICFALTTIDRMLFFFPQSTLATLSYLGAGSHFQNIAKGIIDTRDIIYFLSVVFLGLYGTALAMEEKN